MLALPAWLIVAGATRGGWPRARAWLALVTLGSLLPLVAFALADRQWQGTVPSVALLAATALGLAWMVHIAARPATQPRGLNEARHRP